MSTTPKVCIIILNWNGLADTIDCLESLRTITYPNYEVVVVDNGSWGNDVQALREKYANYIHIIRNDKNYGFAGGNNIAIRRALEHSKPDYFLLLNNDTTVAPDFLRELVAVAVCDTTIGIVGPKIYYYDDPARIWFAGGYINFWLGRFYHRGMNRIDSGQFSHTLDVDFVTGSCMLLSREVLLRVGLLDDSFFFGGEDYDISIRAARHGYKVVLAPKARIWHKVGATTGNDRHRMSAFKTHRYARDHFVVRRKLLNTPQFCVSIVWYLLASVPRLAWLYLRYDRRFSTVKSYAIGLLDYIRKKP